MRIQRSPECSSRCVSRWSSPWQTMMTTPANEIAKEIEGVYRAGMDVKYFPSLPSRATIYDKPLQ